MLYGKAREHLFYSIMGCVFGWIWMVSIPANLFLFCYAIFGYGSWKYLLFSFIIGSVGKWFGKGFYDSADRIVIESFLINRGADRKTARLIWHDVYNDLGRISARNIINMEDYEIEELIIKYCH